MQLDRTNTIALRASIVLSAVWFSVLLLWLVYERAVINDMNYWVIFGKTPPTHFLYVVRGMNDGMLHCGVFWSRFLPALFMPIAVFLATGFALIPALRWVVQPAKASHD